jgi:Tfp pilus assembly protein PilN
MITLDPTAYEYASNMDNFSAFVRDCIHAHARGESIEAVIRQRNYWKAQFDALNEVKK